MNSETEYKQSTLRALSCFQLLEFSLKIYVAVAYDLIRNKLKDDIPFKYDYKDIKKHSLGMLLNTFQKINDNIELQNRLKSLVKGRNRLAHQALLVAHEELRYILDEDLNENRNNVTSLEEELDDCLMIMGSEIQKILSISSVQKPQPPFSP